LLLYGSGAFAFFDKWIADAPSRTPSLTQAASLVDAIKSVF
jgi:hypothetical protein